MRFEGWSVGSESDPGRKRRLAIGYATGLFVCTAVAAVALTVAKQAKSAEEDDTIDVKLATTVEATPTAAPPPPPPPPQPAAPGPIGPRKKTLAVPITIPTDAPDEADPSKAKASGAEGEGAYGDGSSGGPGGTGTGTGAALPPPPPAPPPPPPPPKPSGPIQLPEDATPPQAISNAAPAYPADARTQGVEATIVVKFVVGESGEVMNVTIVRGHPMFDAVVLAAVKSWRYKPAVFQGKPIAVYRVARIPFKIKT